MNAMRLSALRSARLLFLLVLCLAHAPALYAQNDPLPSWNDTPVPNEVYFVLDRVRHMAELDPSLRQRQPFKAALEGDSAYFQRCGASFA